MLSSPVQLLQLHTGCAVLCLYHGGQYLETACRYLRCARDTLEFNTVASNWHPAHGQILLMLKGTCRNLSTASAADGLIGHHDSM